MISIPALTLLTSVLSILTAALPTTIGRRDSFYAIWTVSNYTRGCSPGGCVYSFNISAPAIQNDTTTAFETYCTGPISEDYENYQDDVDCDNPDVKWKLDIEDTVDKIYVSHAFNTPSTSDTPCYHNYTGTQALAKQQVGTFEIVDVYSFNTC